MARCGFWGRYPAVIGRRCWTLQAHTFYSPARQRAVDDHEQCFWYIACFCVQGTLLLYRNGRLRHGKGYRRLSVKPKPLS